MAGINPHTNKLHLTWSDSSCFSWLNPATVLDYFCNTNNPFYNHNCNNELLRMQNADPRQLLYITGLEYQVYLSEPPLYVIRKVDRKSPTDVVELAYYYILNGIVYQSPDFLSVISSRMETAISNLQDAFETLYSSYKYHPSKGYYWNFSISELNRRESSKLRTNTQLQRVDMLLQEFTNRFSPFKQAQQNSVQNPIAAQLPQQQQPQNAEKKPSNETSDTLNIEIKSEILSPASNAPPEKKIRTK